MLLDVNVPARRERTVGSNFVVGVAALALAMGTIAVVSYDHYSRAGALGVKMTATTDKEVKADRSAHQTAHKTITKLAGDDDCKWSYDGNEAPENWPTLCDKKYPLCGGGPTATQSPIDIIESSIEKVNDGFTETIGWVLPADSYANFIKGGNGFLMESNNGHAYQVDNIGAFLMWGPKGQQARYNLVEFHFHTLSEHKVNGEHYDMEMQFVHVLDEATDASHWTWTPKKTLIAAQFFKAGVGMGTPNWLRELAKAAPSLTKDPAQTVPVDFAAISQSVLVGSLPQSGPPNDNFRPNFENYVKYDGSITTPPCTEGVQWVVFRNPIFAEKQDLNPFMALEGENYRPVQPLNGRKLVSNIDKWDNIDLSASGR